MMMAELVHLMVDAIGFTHCGLRPFCSGLHLALVCV